jgi:hypothetical protein
MRSPFHLFEEFPDVGIVEATLQAHAPGRDDEWRHIASLRLLALQAAPKRLVNGVFEADTQTPLKFFQPRGYIFIQGKGGSHASDFSRRAS